MSLKFSKTQVLFANVALEYSPFNPKLIVPSSDWMLNLSAGVKLVSNWSFAVAQACRRIKLAIRLKKIIEHNMVFFFVVKV